MQICIAGRLSVSGHVGDEQLENGSDEEFSGTWDEFVP